MDMRAEAKEALDRADRAVQNVNAYAPDVPPNVKMALIAIVDCLGQLAKAMGVPNAVEPETGRAHVTTAINRD